MCPAPPLLWSFPPSLASRRAEQTAQAVTAPAVRLVRTPAAPALRHLRSIFLLTLRNCREEKRNHTAKKEIQWDNRMEKANLICRLGSSSIDMRRAGRPFLFSFGVSFHFPSDCLCAAFVGARKRGNRTVSWSRGTGSHKQLISMSKTIQVGGGKYRTGSRKQTKWLFFRSTFGGVGQFTQSYPWRPSSDGERQT
jgi:hypothetical protein